MSQVFEGHLVGSDLSFAIVSARWNSFMGEHLLAAAKDTLIRHGVASDKIDVALVPGSFEIPLAAAKLARSKRYDGIVCLGVLIRGGTIHFDLIPAEVTKGIGAVSLETGVPISFGVITTETIEQAIERSGSKAGNKGAEAALAAIEMAQLLKNLP